MFVHNNCTYYMDVYDADLSYVNFDNRKVSISQLKDSAIIDIWASDNGVIEHFDVVEFDEIKIEQHYKDGPTYFIVSNVYNVTSVGNE